MYSVTNNTFSVINSKLSPSTASFNMSANELVDLIECVNFAAIKHKYQRRKDSNKTPYINHAVGKLIKPCHVRDFKWCSSQSIILWNSIIRRLSLYMLYYRKNHAMVQET